MMQEIEDLKRFAASVRRMSTIQRMTNANAIAEDLIEKVSAVLDRLDATNEGLGAAVMLISAQLGSMTEAVLELAGSNTQKADRVRTLLGVKWPAKR